MTSRIRPLKRASPEDGVWASADGRWTFLRAHNDPNPKRWFAYLDGDEFPSNPGEGHTTLRDAAAWAGRYPIAPRP